jgi:hypothetical protein
MSRRRVALVLCGVALVLCAAWWMRARTDVFGRDHRDRADAVDETGEGSVAGRHGVGSREASSAALSVRGRVVDERGEGVEEGTVILRCLDDDEVTAIEGGAVALGDEGWFEGPGCSARICVELHHTSLVPEAAWELRAGVEAELRARSLPRLHGVVVDGRGEPIAAAQVTFTPPDGADPSAVSPFTSRTSSTDADGMFSVARIERAPCGACEIASDRCHDDALPVHVEMLAVVRAKGFGPLERTIEVGAGSYADAADPLRLVLGAPAETLSGVLVDPLGRAYPRAFVLARSTTRQREQLRADVEGTSFELADVGDGAYDLRAIQDGVEIATMVGARPGEDVVLRGELPALGRDLVVEVTDSGRALAGARVDGGPFADARTDMEGRVRGDAVLPGEYTLRVGLPGRAPGSHRIIVPAASDQTGDAEVVATIDVHDL